MRRQDGKGRRGDDCLSVWEAEKAETKDTAFVLSMNRRRQEDKGEGMPEANKEWKKTKKAEEE